MEKRPMAEQSRGEPNRRAIYFCIHPCVLKDTSRSLFKRVLRLRVKNSLLSPHVIELSADPSNWHPVYAFNQITIDNFGLVRIA